MALLTKLGDRMLNKLAPEQVAKAAQCSSGDWRNCPHTPGCIQGCCNGTWCRICACP